jgi:hypothetical protein
LQTTCKLQQPCAKASSSHFRKELTSLGCIAEAFSFHKRKRVELETQSKYFAAQRNQEATVFWPLLESRYCTFLSARVDGKTKAGGGLFVALLLRHVSVFSRWLPAGVFFRASVSARSSLGVLLHLLKPFFPSITALDLDRPSHAIVALKGTADFSNKMSV